MADSDIRAPKCPRCGAGVSPDAPDGLCPRCLMGLNFVTDTEMPEEADLSSTQVLQPPVPAPSPELLAPHFPQLQILEVLGRGGMGVVYKARQPKLERFVAVKILLRRRESAPTDTSFAERFAREARALAQLNHPNIVAVYDYGEAGGYPFLVMEYVEGLTLRQLLQSRKLTPEEALAIVPKICEALQFAHSKGIVHRDIKPENILLDKTGQVKITDFGIAKVISPGAQDRSLTGAKDVVGTPHYMAPEQIEQPAKVDHRADIFSLGVVFYEMLTGELPLGKFSPPSRKVQVDVRLDEVVLHALEKEPERRYQQASQIKTALETIAGSEPCSAVPSDGALQGQPTALWPLRSWKLAGVVISLLASLILASYSISKRHAHRAGEAPIKQQNGAAQQLPSAQKVEQVEVGTVAGHQLYLGGFVEEPLTVRATKLPAHKVLQISFDLCLAGSWDDSSTNLDEKLWDLTLADGRSLLHTTFANGVGLTAKSEQSFPDAYPCRPHPAGTGSLERPAQTWPGSGRTWDLSCVYHFAFPLPHCDSEATFHFKAPAAGAKDRTYGLANLQVIVIAEETPKNDQELSALWKELGSVDPQRAFKAQWNLIAAGDTTVNYMSRHLEEQIDLPPTTIHGLIHDLNATNLQLANAAQTALIGQGRLANAAVALALDGDGTPPESTLELANIQWSIANHPETSTELRLHRARQALLAIHTPAAQNLAKQISPEHYQPQPSMLELLQAGKAACANGDWAKAAESFDNLAAAGALAQSYWILATAAALAANQTNTHLQLCRGYLRRFVDSTDPLLAHRFAKQCLGACWISGDLLEKSTGLAQYAATNLTSSTSPWSSVAKGMAEYRQGNWSNALESLRRPEQTAQIDNSTLALAVAAMARHQLGDAASARRSLEELNRRLNMYIQTGELSENLEGEWDNKALAFVLRAEAERLILGREVSPPLDIATVDQGRARWQPIRALLKTGEELASQNKWAEASDAVTAAYAAPGFSWDLWELAPCARVWSGPAFLLSSNQTRHVELCRILLGRTNAEVPLVAVEAYASLFLANTGVLPPDLQDRALAYARQAYQRAEKEGSPFLPLLRRMLVYRQGEYSKAAVSVTETDSTSDPLTKARAMAFRGMANFHLGEVKEARRALEKAEEYLAHGPNCCIRDLGWWGMGLGETALKELRALLGAQEPPRPRLSGVITVGPASEAGRLTFAGAATAEELTGVVDLTVSTNGQFLYSAAFISGVVGVYARDRNSGQLSPVQFLQNDSDLKGTISIRLSPDQCYAVASAIRSKTVVLFKRDPESGRLEQLRVLRSQDGVQGLNFPVRARFSLDGQHLYVLEGARSGGISAFKFTPGEELQWLQTFTNSNTGSSRAVAMLPDGNSIVTVNSSSHTLTVFDRAPASGRLSLRQALSDVDAGVTQIEGQFGVTASLDGKFVYVCSGRFSGDNAVSVFRLNSEQKLVPIQAFMNGQDGLTFVGGNEVIVSPDGLNVYATATLSGTLACFARDPQNGRLRLIQSIVEDKQTVHLEGPAGLECSPDGRFVYVPLEKQKAIAIYRRELAHSAKSVN